MKKKKIAVIVGSLRKEAFSRKTARALMKMDPASFEMEEVKLGELLIYNQDLDDEGKPPAAWTTFRELMKKFDGFIFVTPEYNRSVPGLLKNALDVGSRPNGESIWDGKPGAIVSTSPGRLSGFGANHHLRQSMAFLNVPTMQQPEAYIGNVAVLFDEKGDLIDKNTQKFFQNFMDSFVSWVDKIIPDNKKAGVSILH